MTSMVGAPLVMKPRVVARSSSRVRAMRCNAAAATDAPERTAAFPFVKIVGQEELKLALILNVIVGRQSLLPLVSLGRAFMTNRAAIVWPVLWLRTDPREKKKITLPASNATISDSASLPL